jgi:hypothetical protein
MLKSPLILAFVVAAFIPATARACSDDLLYHLQLAESFAKDLNVGYSDPNPQVNEDLENGDWDNLDHELKYIMDNPAPDANDSNFTTIWSCGVSAYRSYDFLTAEDDIHQFDIHYNSDDSRFLADADLISLRGDGIRLYGDRFDLVSPFEYGRLKQAIKKRFALCHHHFRSWESEGRKEVH